MSHKHEYPIEIITKDPADITYQESLAISRIAGASFGLGDTPAMRQDTLNHIEASETINMAYEQGQVVGASMASVVIQDKVFELTGVIIHPDHQRRRIGQLLLRAHAHTLDLEYMVACTRNPNVLRTAGRLGSSGVYPLVRDKTLYDIAAQMPYASDIDGVLYHINRYNQGGLFAEDPAELPFQADGMPLKKQFPDLENIRNALVLAARIN